MTVELLWGRIQVDGDTSASRCAGCELASSEANYEMETNR
jgi:hypothetical protein